VPLSYLHHYARAPAEWRARAVPGRYVEMNRLPKDAIDMRAALRSLPPLIKGYLRAGAYIGDGAVVDRQFGTTDVLIVLPVAAISARYAQHFGAQRRAA
jgi:putative hemolysin